MPICIKLVEKCKIWCYVQRMIKQQIKEIIESRVSQNSLEETGLTGVQLIHVTQPISCAPAVYEPTVVAIVSGVKEAIFDGRSYVYDSSRYLCCPMSMPVEAGTPKASPEHPLLGVKIDLDTKIMSSLAREMDIAGGVFRRTRGDYSKTGLILARWDDAFSEALLRLLKLMDRPTDLAILKEARLRELYYAILKGDAGESARRAFSGGNEIARAIELMSQNIDRAVTIEEIAQQVGMSRAVFHRKFKQATTMSPIQFMKSMKLNNAAMKLAGGMNVNEAAMGVGYVSSSQFSREFKRMYGQSPRQWSQSLQLPPGMI